MSHDGKSSTAYKFKGCELEVLFLTKNTSSETGERESQTDDTVMKSHELLRNCPQLFAVALSSSFQTG